MTSLTWTFPNNLQSHRRKEGQTPSLSNRMVLCLISVTSLFSLSMKHFAIDSSKRVVQIHGQLQSLILFQQIIFFFLCGKHRSKVSPCTPWRHMWEWRYSSMHSKPHNTLHICVWSASCPDPLCTQESSCHYTVNRRLTALSQCFR